MTRPGIEPRSPGPLGEHSNRWANVPVLVKIDVRRNESGICCSDKKENKEKNV